MFNFIKKNTVFNPNEYQQENIENAVFNNSYEVGKEDILIIQDYYQKNINSNIIFGMPSDLSPYFENSHMYAKQFFKDNSSSDYFTIEPIIFISEDNYKSYLLPQFLTMATIDRTIPLNGSNDIFSTLNVIWWQNTLGVPEEDILDKIKQIDWKSPYAYSWNL